MLSGTTYQEAGTCHSLFGKKDLSTTIEQRLDVKSFLTQSGANFHHACFLHHLSKVLKMFCGDDTCKVLRPKLNQAQSELITSTHILAEGVKFCYVGHLLYLRVDLLLSAEKCLISVSETCK